MGKLISIFRDTYIRFLVWLGAAAPAGYEHYLPNKERPREYTLQEGETIFSVARKFGVHYDRIARANNIEDLESVQAGQTLVIPTADWEPDTEPVSETPLEDEEPELLVDQPEAGIEIEEDIPGLPPEPPAEIIPPAEEIAEPEPMDWLAEAEQSGEPISSAEEPTLLPDETELPTELPDETTASDEASSIDEVEWLLATEPTPEIATADSLSMADSATLDKDVEWLVATEPITSQLQASPKEATTIQEEIPFEPSALQEELPATETQIEREPTPTPIPAELPLDDQMIFRYEVQRGDTLSSIAKRYSVTVKEIVEANDIADPSRIFPGQKLVIPGYLMPKPEETEQEPSPEPMPPSSAEFFVYAVVEGDTISSIAKRYGVTLRELVEANNIEDPNRLWVGQRLYIPGILQQRAEQPKEAEAIPRPLPEIKVAAPQVAPVTDPNFLPIGPLDAVRALYLSYFAVAHGDSLKRMFQLLNRTEFNAVVIDVKGEHGWISYPSQIPQAHGIDQAHPTVKDFAVVMRELKARGVYTIARIVTFKDHPLATSRSDLSLKTTSGSIWQDRDNTSWSDPFLKPVWDYNIQLAVEAAQKGFDEIQFDYLRFPNASQAGTPQYSQDVSKETRVAAITGFLSTAKGQLEPFGIKITADTFGYTCWRKDDTLIGQDIERMAQYLDILSPKLYPSSFGNGIPQYKEAIAYPYEVVFESAKRAVERVRKYGCVVRPWLQDFPDYRFDKRVYGKEEIQAQIKGSFDAGANGFMVWNPDVKYTDNAYAPVSQA